jgi:heat-inducible transcriptional repressor
MLSFITPPVALGAFAAATISGSDPMRAGFTAMRIGSIIYFIPFFFVMEPALILRGQAQLLTDVSALEDLERIRSLFETLEEKESTLRLIDSTGEAEGVQIFIGAENALFRHTGCSMIIAPYHDQRRTIVGAIGVIGPTRMNYARIIPMVDYTAKLIGRLLD